MCHESEGDSGEQLADQSWLPQACSNLAEQARDEQEDQQDIEQFHQAAPCRALFCGVYWGCVSAESFL
ncbi:MAG: hypothetical protein P8Y27_07670 [Chromatiaceae bacterium]